MMAAAGILGAALILSAAPALAQAGPARFCPNRPSLGSSACTVDPGRVLVEVSAIDWQRNDGPDERDDSIQVASTQLRLGVDDQTEAQLSWTPYGRSRVREKTTGTVSSVAGVGDVRVGVRRNLRHPDGGGLSVAVEPFVSLPVGRDRLGAGDWGGGVVLPVTYELDDRIDLGFTAELDAAVDGDGDGRHAAFSATAGAGYALTDQVAMVVEVQLGRDQDPVERSTVALGALSLAYQLQPGFQLDIFAAAGLNRASPDIRLLTGAAFLF